MNKEWQFYNPFFEYVEDFNDEKIPWLGHIFFAYDLIRNFKPTTVAELGTFRGTSFYSMCQAVKDDSYNATLFAIDAWEGDENTGYYGDDIYQHVSQIVRKYYRDVKARLMRMWFADAVKEFKNESIDLLHIDGLHTYEAVKEDYNMWKNKVSKDGIIMFHDVSIADFGVWKLWEEVQKEEKGALFIDFTHSAGLGVVIRNKQLQTILKDYDLEAFKNHYSQAYANHKKYLHLLNVRTEAYVNARGKYRKTLEDAKLIIEKNKELQALNNQSKNPFKKLFK